MQALNEHVLISGPTGSGKSHLTGAVFEQYYLNGRQWILLDTKQLNHIGLYQLKDVKLLQIKPDTFYSFEKALNYPYILCIPDRRTRTRDLIDIYSQFLEIAYDERRPGTYGIEEAHLFNNGPNAPSDILELLCRDGRGYNQNLVFATQRIQDFPKLLWSQCKKSYVFKSLIPQDIAYLAQIIPEYPALNYKLKPHDCLKYHNDKNIYTLIPAQNIRRITPHYG